MDKRDKSMADSQIQRIYHQIQNELFSFSNELNKLSALNYPTKTCYDLIGELREKIKKYHSLMLKIKNDEDEGNPEETRRKLITKIHNPLVQQDVLYLDWILNAQTSKVPWSFIPCIEDLAKEIVPDHQIIVYCENHYNYSICWSQSKKLAPYPYYVLALPRLHRVNILWHTLIGHELFHPRCSEFIDLHNQDVLANITRKVTEEFKKSGKSEEDKDLFIKSEKKNRIDGESNIIHIAWRRATEELLSDMACVELFGPAAVLAMWAFSACSPLNDIPIPNNFYPSNLYRFEIVWEHFIDAKNIEALCSDIDKDISKCFKENMEQFSTLISKGEGAGLVQKHPQAKIAYQEVERLLPEMVKFVKTQLSEGIHKWHHKEITQQIPKLVERLKNGIPPNEIIIEINEMKDDVRYETKPAKLPAILIAGWIYETYWQKTFKENGDTMKYKTMSRLLLKACEDSRTTKG